MRVVGQVRQRRAQARDRGADGAPVGAKVAGQRELVRRVARPANQVDAEVALDHASRLADLAVVQAHEIGCFRGERRRVSLARMNEAVEHGGKIVKVGFHRRHAGGLFARRHHSAPPNTETSLNTQAGEAWPTRMACDGSPLPQCGVPSTRIVPALPTRTRLRQKFALIPR